MNRPYFLALLLIPFFGIAQKPGIGLAEGTIESLKGQNSVNIEFCYDGMKVGKMENEREYVQKKKEDYNKKTAGKGDSWEKSWYADRKINYEPFFKEFFTKESGYSVKPDAPLTFIFITTFTEPGFNVGVQSKNAEISGDAFLVETGNWHKVLAKIHIERAHSTGAAVMWGADFNDNDRIKHTYSGAGWSLGRFIVDKRSGFLSGHSLDPSKIVSKVTDADYNNCLAQLSQSPGQPAVVSSAALVSTPKNTTPATTTKRPGDLISKKDGTKIQAKVLEVNVADVKYKKYSNLSGPTYTVLISDLQSILYENGEEEVYAQPAGQKPIASTPAKQSSAPIPKAAVTTTTAATTAVVSGSPVSSTAVPTTQTESKSVTPGLESSGAVIQIGPQNWAAKNLAVKTFANGDPIPQAISKEQWKEATKNEKPVWCYIDDDPANARFGLLYNWYAVMDPRGLAPKGWHIPKIEEAESLIEISKTTTDGRLFGGTMEGVRLDNGDFHYKDRRGFWWTSSDYRTSVAWDFSVGDLATPVYTKSTHYKGWGDYVRCLKD